MQCSDNVADIATALSQAQIELANPEKTSLGRIIEPSGRDVQFRYASLASAGLICRPEPQQTAPPAFRHGKFNRFSCLRNRWQSATNALRC